MTAASGTAAPRMSSTGATAAAWSPIHHRVRRAAERFADRVAIDGTEGELSYRRLAAQTAALAARLRAAGVGEGDLVAILTPRTSEVIPSILAVLEAGGAFVPLDLHSTPARLEDAFAEVQPRFCIAAPEHRERVESCGAKAGSEPVVIELDGGELDGGELTAEEAVRDPDGLAYVYFTSGSTGRPKPIAGRLKAIDHFMRWEIDTFGLMSEEGDETGIRASQLTSPAFDAFLRDAFVPLLAGGTVCVPPSREIVLDGARLADWLEAAGVELLHTTPSILRLLLAEELTGGRFPDLRFVLLAGEALQPADVRRWHGVFGSRIELVNLYGPSETTLIKLFHRVRPEDGGAALVPIGRPMDGARAVVLDDQGRPCPPGRLGEIYLRTPYRTLGYYQRPEQSREVFVPNPLGSSPDDIVYKTGDFGRLREDGAFEVIGRRDQQVKVRGVRVEIGPIEEILRSADGVVDAAVVDRTDSQGNTYLCAYVAAGGEVDRRAVEAELTGRLPESMLPSAWVLLERLPRTLSGKVDRRALPEPGGRSLDPGRERTAPRNEIEETLCRLVGEVLNLSEVGVHDDFFAIGGHSLLVARLLARVRRELRAEVSLEDFFAASTVEGLAVAVARSRLAGSDPDRTADLLSEIESLSEDEIRRRLAGDDRR